MRKRFEQPETLDCVAIKDIKIDLTSRDEFPQLLRGLLYVFTEPKINEAIFKIIEERVLGGKKATGRSGMSLWELFVLGMVRLNLNIDYDRLQDLANNHETMRGVMGVHSKKIFGEGSYYQLQTIKDNVGLLDEQTLLKINEEIVKAGHELKKREEGIEVVSLNLKTDSFVVESNIHFPTDLNLLWDSVRKCLDTIKMLKEKAEIEGWRKIAYWYIKLKRLFRKSANIHRVKGKDYKERLNVEVERYLKDAREILSKVEQTLKELEKKGDMEIALLIIVLKQFKEYLEKFIDLTERRIIKGEQIPHGEKIFSIFEPHTEWLSKGKEGKQVELGHNVLITTDQYQFIVDFEVVIKKTDEALVIPLGERLKARFTKEGYVLWSLSFDRGFYSGPGKKSLEKIFNEVIMPKPGKKSQKQYTQEHQESFIKLRRKHSAVESNINELECGGADKVPDKGLNGFKKYIAWSVVAYNLKRIGKMLQQKELNLIKAAA